MVTRRSLLKVVVAAPIVNALPKVKAITTLEDPAKYLVRIPYPSARQHGKSLMQDFLLAHADLSKWNYISYSHANPEGKPFTKEDQVRLREKLKSRYPTIEFDSLT